VPEEGLEPS